MFPLFTKVSLTCYRN